MKIDIDSKSGFCFGVVYAIEAAEQQLQKHGKLYCLGDIVHNEAEVLRLRQLGLITIDHEKLKTLKNERVMIRAHGEPPSTYAIALANNIELVDASCPVVLKLQNKVKKGFDKMTSTDGQVVIFGKKGHAEVVGLTGQTADKAIVIANNNDAKAIDYNKPICLFAQTTKPKQALADIYQHIKEQSEAIHGQGKAPLVLHDSICRQVSNRAPELQKFARQYDVIVFVSGKQSSNGRTLYTVCKTNNEQSYFVSNASELHKEWFGKASQIGIAGATSTPLWLMENVRTAILDIMS